MHKMQWSLLATLIIACLFCSALSANSSIASSHRSQGVTDTVQPIAVYGDTRNGHQTHKKIVQCMLEHKPQAVFHTGDLVFNGRSQRHWDVFNAIVADLVKVAPLYPAMGNHELGRIKVQQNVRLPNNGRWYAIDLQNIHFVVLDVTSCYGVKSTQYQWILDNLATQPASTKFTVVFLHYPIYTSSFHQTQLKKLRKTLVPLFEKYGVDVVFSAHNHSYERCYSGGIYYITTAGGGAPLYAQQRKEPTSQLYVHTNHYCLLTQQHDSLFVSAYDTNQHQIDRFGMMRR